jgi:hypothetical protein
LFVATAAVSPAIFYLLAAAANARQKMIGENCDHRDTIDRDEK